MIIQHIRNGLALATYFLRLLTVGAHSSGYTLIGDMLFPTIPNNEENSENRAGAYGVGGSKLNLTWKNNRIPYEMHSSITKNVKLTRKIIMAMDDIMQAVPNCIRFEPKGNNDTHWLRIQNVDARTPNCYAEVGFRKKSPQVIELRPRCPQGTYVHEFLHTLGYLHEHTRNDRDDYVSINWENIYERFRGNYILDKDVTNVKPVYHTSYYGVPYNYESIMHYPLTGGNTVIDSEYLAMEHKKNQSGMGVNKEPGQRYYLSHGDLMMIANKHGCEMPDRYQYELTGAEVSSNSDFEEHGLGPENDFDEPLHNDEEENSKYCARRCKSYKKVVATRQLKKCSN